jgi:hypothetical protein
MGIQSKQLLSILGYEIDNRGNVRCSTNQLAILSLEKEPDGAILRVHGTDNDFFYSTDPLVEEKDLLFPSKITSKYVYFQGRTETLRVEAKEFSDSTLKAFFEFSKISGKKLAG